MTNAMTAPKPGSEYPDGRCPHLGGICRVITERDRLRAENERLATVGNDMIALYREEKEKREQAEAALAALKEKVGSVLEISKDTYLTSDMQSALDVLRAALAARDAKKEGA